MPNSSPSLIVQTLHELLTEKIPPREMLLSPIIPSQGLVMLYAARGIGKTHVSLSIAISVATGASTLDGRFVCDKPRGVLFVDGEMPSVTLQERLAKICESYQIPSELPSLKILAADKQPLGIPDLTTSEGQDAIGEHLDGVELLILDNLSSLMRNGKENESESWNSAQHWLLKLRRKGISVLFVHHSSKGGGQRGTSKREDILDTVITLKHPQDYEPQQGARFEVHYEKTRGFFGADAEPFEVSFCNGKWQAKNLENEMLLRVSELHAKHLPQRDIADELNISLGQVNRLIKRIKQERSTVPFSSLRNTGT